MAKRIIWSDSALKSRVEILQFWIEKTGNKKYSRKLSKELNARVDHLKYYPKIGKPTELEEIRTTACGHFSIFYQILKNEILIIALYDTRRNPTDLIEKLKKGS